MPSQPGLMGVAPDPASLMRPCRGFPLELEAGWDRLRASEMQPERDHHLTREKTNAGEAPGPESRDADRGGWSEAQRLRLAGIP